MIVSVRNLDFLLNKQAKHSSDSWSLKLNDSTQELLKSTHEKKRASRVAEVLKLMGYSQVEIVPKDTAVNIWNYAFEPSTQTHFVEV